jgi:hypothetical protein
MSFTETLVQRLSVVDKLDPVSQTNATVNMAAVDTLYFGRLMYVINVGAIGAAGTVDFKLQSCATSGGTYVDIAGKAITQIIAASKIAKIGVMAEDLGTLATPARFVRGVLTVGVNAVLICVTAYGAVGRWKPENKFNEIAAVFSTISD